MTTYNTGNPIGSTDPRDLYDNAQNLDTAMHTAATTWADRLGNTRPSWAGATGYQSLGDYAAGIQVTTYNQVIRAAGEYWRAAAGTALPYTTTGAGMPESGKFVSVGDAVLRADLVEGDGSSIVGFQQAGAGAVVRTSQAKLREYMSVTDFGADPAGLVDAGPAFQAAIDAAAGEPVLIPPGTYKIATPIVYNTTGMGNVEAPKLVGSGQFKSVLDNQTGGVLFNFTSGSSMADFQNHLVLSGFGIVNTLAQAGSVGVKLTGIRYGVVSIRVANQASHGLWLDSPVGDATDVFHVDFKNGDFFANGGWGIYITATTGVHANLHFCNNRMVLNALGGIYAESIVTCEFSRNAYAYNNGPGLKITNQAGGNSPKNIKVWVEEHDTNHGAQIVLENLVGADLDQVYLVANSGLSQVFSKGIQLLNTRNVAINKAAPRSGEVTGITLIEIASTAFDTQINGTEVSSWSSPGNTLYSDASTSTRYDGLVYGTWVPVDNSGAGLALSVASASYVKEGKKVFVSAAITLPTTADVSSIAIGGLPFQVAQNSVGSLLQSTAVSGDSALLPIGTSSIYIYGPSFARRKNSDYSATALYVTATYLTT